MFMDTMDKGFESISHLLNIFFITLCDILMANNLLINDPINLSVFSHYGFEEALRLKSIVLAQPSTWEDPMETIGRLIVIVQTKNGKRIDENIHVPYERIFAQCWSATKESDTLLRAYSRVKKDPIIHRNLLPGEEGVRVRSSARKVLNVLETGIPKGRIGRSYIGCVQYLSYEGLSLL
jgi:hypothetical protein